MIENNERPTQASRLLAYLKKHKYITQMEALNSLGIWRLASRISELQHKHGIAVDSDFITVPNRYGEKCNVKRYWLAEEKPAFDSKEKLEYYPEDVEYVQGYGKVH